MGEAVAFVAAGPPAKASGLLDAQHPVCENARSQAAVAFEEGFGARGDGIVHPVAGAAFFGAFKFDALHAETLSYQSVEIHARGEHVAAKELRVQVGQVALFADAFVDVPIEKSDLSFEVRFMVEVAVVYEAAPCEAFHGIHFLNTVVEASFAVAADEVVSAGNINGFYFYIHGSG